MEVNGQLNAPAVLALGKELLMQLNRRLGGPIAVLEALEKAKNLSC